jgi:hypothetical protein
LGANFQVTSESATMRMAELQMMHRLHQKDLRGCFLLVSGSSSQLFSVSSSSRLKGGSSVNLKDMLRPPWLPALMLLPTSVLILLPRSENSSSSYSMERMESPHGRDISMELPARFHCLLNMVVGLGTQLSYPFPPCLLANQQRLMKHSSATTLAFCKRRTGVDLVRITV